MVESWFSMLLRGSLIENFNYKGLLGYANCVMYKACLCNNWVMNHFTKAVSSVIKCNSKNFKNDNES